METQNNNPGQTMKIQKRTKLVDGNGNKLVRKIRRDEKGLYVINHGMKGYLIKTVKAYTCDIYRAITTTRKVDYYV